MLLPFWKRRHPVTRVVFLAIAIVPCILYGYIKHLIQEVIEEWPSMKREIPNLFRECWNTPQEKR